LGYPTKSSWKGASNTEGYEKTLRLALTRKNPSRIRINH